VPSAPIPTLPLDIDILREMYRGGAVNLAGIDPRLNATTIAQRLRVGRARVAGRLRVWREAGFLQRFDVWINPALLDWQGAWLDLRVARPRQKPELFRRLGLVDGIVSALEFVGEWTSVGLIAPDPGTLERRVALLHGLSDVVEVAGPNPWRSPVPTRSLTPLDLRIARALRAQPMASLHETARRAGISTRTMTRRYEDLVESGAVWFVPVYDFRALVNPVVSLSLRLGTGTSRESIARAVRKRFPLVLGSRMESDVAIGPDVLVLFVLPPSAALLEEVERSAAALPGVEGVEAFTLVRMHSYPEWFDQQLTALSLGGRPPPRRRGLPSPS
jgi:DNA-binding Lrp family transcriptional regulator